jgi:hypothetical protein
LPADAALLEAATAPLSHPRVAGRAEIVRAIIDAHSDVVLERARERYGARLAACSGLLETVEAAVRADAGWSPPFGGFESAVRSGDASGSIVGAARIALWGHDHGLSGSWTAEFDAPALMRIGDVAATEMAALEVQAATDGYELRGHTTTRDPVEWRIVHGAAAPVAAGLGSTTFAQQPVRLSTASDLDAIAGAEFLHDAVWTLSDDLPRATQEIAAAEQLLLTPGPEFHGWVQGVLRQALFTNPGAGLLESGSSRLVPGFVHVAHGEPVAIAEMLTHELSHQYYYVATRLGAVDDGTDSELYWSPVKQRGRPIANILLAYHAFGNVLLLMRALLDASVTPAEPILKNVEDLTTQLVELQRALETTKALTDVGLGLYVPLRDALELDSAVQ